MSPLHRRDFIRTALFGGIAASCISCLDTFQGAGNRNAGKAGAGLPGTGSAGASPARVSLTHGEDRADMAFRALEPFSKEITRAIGQKKVILKPNNVTTDNQLSATHVDTLEGILEFLKAIRKLDNVVIAESAATGPSFDAYENFGYMKLAGKYPVKFIDLDDEPVTLVYVFNQKDIRPHPVRVASMILDPCSYLVSVARMKTHIGVIATLSLKNLLVGAPVKDKGFTYDEHRKSGTENDKVVVHGGGYHGINYNLYAMAGQFHPHLAVIDGFEGMEGNGPTKGSPVDHRVCVAGTDWLAADRVGVELMGIDFSKVGYLNYCAETGMGKADLMSIEVIGEKLDDHIRSYRLPDNYESQLAWMEPLT